MVFLEVSALRRPAAIALAAALAASVGVTACSKKSEPQAGNDTALVSQIKSGVAERERRLTSYRLVGKVSEGGNEMPFEFVYRAPNRLRGTVGAPGSQQTYSFDGDRFFQLDEAKKTLTVFEMKLPPDKAALFLHETFKPLAPEGYRAPVLDFSTATARRVQHPKTTDAVELTSTAKTEGVGDIQVTYLFRHPQMDLLEKRMRATTGTMTLTVDEEQCDEKLKLCVPKRVSQKYDGQPGATTTLSTVELNAAVPAESFSLAAPEGYSMSKRELVESE